MTKELIDPTLFFLVILIGTFFAWIAIRFESKRHSAKSVEPKNPDPYKDMVSEKM